MKCSAGESGFGQFNIERVLRNFLPDRIPETFEELTIPLSVTATDFYGQREVPIANGDLFSAIARFGSHTGIVPARQA